MSLIVDTVRITVTVSMGDPVIRRSGVQLDLLQHHHHHCHDRRRHTAAPRSVDWSANTSPQNEVRHARHSRRFTIFATWPSQ